MEPTTTVPSPGDPTGIVLARFSPELPDTEIDRLITSIGGVSEWVCNFAEGVRGVRRHGTSVEALADDLASLRGVLRVEVERWENVGGRRSP